MKAAAGYNSDGNVSGQHEGGETSQQQLQIVSFQEWGDALGLACATGLVHTSCERHAPSLIHMGPPSSPIPAPAQGILLG